MRREKEQKKKGRALTVFLSFFISLIIFAGAGYLVLDYVGFFTEKDAPTQWFGMWFGSSGEGGSSYYELEPDDEDYDVPPRAMEKVPVDFFDVLFIGDSRTVGFQANSGAEGADYFAVTGISANAIRGEQCYVRGQSRSWKQTLTSKEYKVIHVMLGVNDLHETEDGFREVYGELLEEIREYQPDALIILAANLEVTAYNSYGLSNSKVQKFNRIIEEFSHEKNTVYLDVNPIFSENGYLCESLSRDGLHLKEAYYPNWADWLRRKLDRLFGYDS